MMRSGIKWWLLMLLLLPMIERASAQNDLSGLVERVAPCVVKLETFDSRGREVGTGSGFFIESNALVTNRHVIHGADSARAKFPNGTVLTITGVIGVSTIADLVILTTEGSARAFLPLREALPKPGERLVVIGSPLGLEQSVSDGIVSAVRDVDGHGTVIQITAPISPGSSGSPVVDSEGRVLGVATFRLVGGENLNFAIPASLISHIQRTPSQSLSIWWPLNAPEEKHWESKFSAQYDIRLDQKIIGTQRIRVESDGMRYKTTFQIDMQWKGNKRTHSGSQTIECLEQLDGTPIAITFECDWPWVTADLEFRFEGDRLICLRRVNGKVKMETLPNTFAHALMPNASDREYMRQVENQAAEFKLVLISMDATGLGTEDERCIAIADEQFEHHRQKYTAKAWQVISVRDGVEQPMRLQKIAIVDDRPVILYGEQDSPLGRIELVVRNFGE